MLPVPDRPLVFLTTISASPPACAGVVAVIDVAETTVTLVAAVPPIATVAPALNPVPVIVMAVPPLLLPRATLTADIVGAPLTGVSELVTMSFVKLDDKIGE